MAKKKKNKKNQKKTVNKEVQKQNKILKNLFIIFGLVLVLIFAYYAYAQYQTHINYKDVSFEASRYGEVLFYETTTFAESNDGTNQPFGFRLRTNPRDLKDVPFENLENFSLLKVNGYSYGENDFNCQGQAVLAMENLKRTFSKMGMSFVRDENETCDADGRYNFFKLTLGNETKINQIGNRCYEITVKGTEDSCEILKGTEKLMVEMYVKYLNLE